ncbi:MAG: glycosyltransferase [Firmicutes bacterium]|nr:glycosyltransferase [Bacillota bacterium]
MESNNQNAQLNGEIGGTMTTETAENLDMMKKAIDSADIVSFDIFDTLMVRLTARAEDIFRLMELKTGIRGFAEKRQTLQTECSLMTERTKGEPHCTFDDIYEYLEKNAGLDTGRYSWAELKQLELDTEKRLLVRNTPMFEIFSYAKKQGKRVVAVSDMYLGRKEIEPFLQNCGYTGFDEIYVSADVKKTKYRLDLFEYVVNAEKVNAAQIVHIGDSLKDDFENAKKCGLNAVLYKGHRNKADVSLYRSISTGAANLIKNEGHGFWAELGAAVGGPLYGGILCELNKQIAQKQPDKVFFLARDGYDLFELADEECTGLTGIKKEYLYASRRAMLLCGMNSLSDENKKQLPPFTFGQSIKELLAYLDMAEVKEESVKNAGFDGYESIIRSRRDFDKFRSIFDAEKELFLKKCEEERTAFKNYLQKTGFLDSKALVFDCGWNGSSQYLLDKAAELMDYKGENSFIYVGLTDGDKCRRQLKDRKYDTILFGKGKNSGLWKRLGRSVVLLELFFGAPHGSVWKYADNKDGFILEDIESQFDYKQELLDGIRAFLRLACPLFNEYALVPTAEDCLAEVFRLIEEPTVEEAVNIGDLENMDGFAAKKNVKKYIAKLTKDDITDELNEFYWPQGIYTRPDIDDEVKEFVRKKTGVTMSENKNEAQPAEKRPNVFKRVMGYIDNYGLMTTCYLVKNRNRLKTAKKPFETFIENTEKNLLLTEPLDYRPLFSFVVPVYNVLDEQLRECIDSILNQTYDNFELILVDDKSTWESVPKVLAEYESDPRITVIYRNENGHISRCTNTGIEAAKGEYIVFTDCDDVLAPNAVYEMTKVVNEDKSIDFIYSDEDKLSDDGTMRHFPHFKPDWSPDTFMSHMYTSHLSAYRRSIVNEIGGLRVGFEGAQDYDFTIRFTEKTDRVAHIPKILYHWRQRPESTATDLGVKPYVMNAMLNLKKEALERRGLKGEVVYDPEVFQHRVIYKPEGEPLVSIIIPSKDNYDIFERCIKTLVEKTEYKNYELVVADNGSKPENRKKYEKLCEDVNAVYHYEKMDFNFSKMCNIGAKISKGSYLLFLNDDIEIINGVWLERMLGQACLKHTGAVGAKLLYPNSTEIQHCGIINLQRGPCHAFMHMTDSVPLYFSRNKIDYNYIAVTAACLCVSREKFDAVKGFDEELTVGYNDVDLCFKLYENGLYNVVRTDAVLWHHESVSRGLDAEDPEKRKRLAKEFDKLNKKHPNLVGKDPFYNPNLIKDRVDFNIDLTRSVGSAKLVKAGLDVTPLLNDRVQACIDDCWKGKLTEISGWAFIGNMPLNNLDKKYVLFVDENDTAVAFETETVLRFDVSAAYGTKCGLNLSGYKCSILTENLQPGRYRLGILVENKLMFKRYAKLFDEYIDVE